MARTVLMSIRPGYAEKILAGLKQYELRKRFGIRTGDRIILYASTPIKAVVGEFRAGVVIAGSCVDVTVPEVWTRTIFLIY